MVIDSSVILALLFNEPEADDIETAIDEDPVRLMSVASGLEAAIVVEARLGAAGGREFDLLLHKTRIELVTVTDEQMEAGRTAWRRFGRGRHDANLNFGDCFSYALAATSGEPLLFKGDGFSKTDVPRVRLRRD
jgi:ribonuclease VapC